MKSIEEMQTILIVDDAPINITLLGNLFKDNYIVQVANQGTTAIEIATGDDPPDLILLDVVMPEMTGYEVCKVLKNNKKTENIPIIFITGKDGTQDEIKAFELGAVDYITRPFNPVIVKARVNTHMELKRYRDFLENMSLIDGLTGIANRRKFDEYFDIVWNLGLREGIEQSVILIDIDHFKSYNDSYGHQAGDDCLIRIAREIASHVRRKTDLVARYGGEEFVCILPDTSEEDALKIADHLRQSIEALGIPHKASEVSSCVTVSVGVATIVPMQGMLSQGLLKAADQALYYSKQSGRNQVAAYPNL
ncbi:MAG: diguanylate cyclase [Clostridia bacterium]|nr:diguanylate cyclase [Clostridia bacterium]